MKILQTAIENSEEETIFLLDQASKNNFIKGVVGWLDIKSSKLNDLLSWYKIKFQLTVSSYMTVKEVEPKSHVIAFWFWQLKEFWSFNK